MNPTNQKTLTELVLAVGVVLVLWFWSWVLVLVFGSGPRFWSPGLTRAPVVMPTGPPGRDQGEDPVLLVLRLGSDLPQRQDREEGLHSR